MSKLRKCPNCGGAVYDAPDHDFCMYCGQALTLPAVETDEQEELRPKKKQTLAAVLMVIPTLVVMSMDFGFTLASELSRLFLAIGNVLYIAAWAVLLAAASNKATRMAVFIALGVNGLQLIIEQMDIFAGDSIFLIILSVALNVAYVYMYSLIAQNNYLRLENRIWVNMLPVILCSFFAFNICWSALKDCQSFQNFILYDRAYYGCWSLLANVLQLIALWKLARCEAFSGKYDDAAAPDYMPFNKYVAAVFVVPAAVVLAMYLLYAFEEVFV